MKKQRFFNMIEVLLALAISAIGITSILGIIPLGLKANRNAMSETFAADIANSYFAELSILAAYSADFDAFVGSVEKTFPEVSKSTLSVDGNNVSVYENPTTPDPDDWKVDGVIEFSHEFKDDGVDFDTSNAVSKHYIRAYVGKKDGTNKVTPDFVADICGWHCYPDDIPDVDNSDTDGNRNLVRVYLEVSWPVNTAYANREKRIFVREFFDTRAPVAED